MTYYEELGIQADASAEEIRQAYKGLARLLHPDGQTDPKLRQLAECQMKRLGEVAAILSNAQKRRQYDAELANGRQQVVKVAWARVRRAPVKRAVSWPWWIRRAAQNGFWILLGMGVLGVGGWYFATRDSDRAGRAMETAPAVAAVPAGQSAAAAPAKRKPKAVERRPSQRIRKRPLPELPPEVKAVPQKTNVETAARTVPAAPGPQAQAGGGLPAAAKPEATHPAVAAEEPQFAGNWLYAPEAGTAAPGQYRASYVELVLQEEHGTLAGHYRSRHKIPDKAISPEVLLRVQGRTSAEKSAKLEWASPDGAKGEMELTLRAPNLVNVTWWTTQFGRQSALASGRAVLVRQATR